MNKLFTWMKQSKLSLLLALILAVGLLVGGCGGGSDSYTDHTVQKLTKTDSPIITPETLKSWMDAGLVNAGYMPDNVVIMQVSTQSDYSAAKIPDALLWDSGTELNQSRVEGLGLSTTMTVEGSTMDAILQRNGVNSLSTIVLTYPGINVSAMYGASRAYFHLRYWGFPKDKIKFLNGGNNGWQATVLAENWDIAAYGLTSNIPSVDRSTFSVRNNLLLRSELRYSLGEMLQAVDQNNASLAATPAQRAVNIVQQTAFDSAIISNAIGIPAADFVETELVEGLTVAKFKTVTGLNELFDTAPYDASFDKNLLTITHCVSGTSCMPSFVALDAVLGWQAAVYDGSANQWNAYRARAANPTGDPVLTGAALTAWRLLPPDEWRTDLFGRSKDDTILYSGRLEIDLKEFSSIDDPKSNQIENSDKDYMNPAAPPTSVGGGEASGC